MLSGGERNRVHLAKMLQGAAATCCCSTSPPTTSTSTPCAPSRTALEAFPGCAVVISHDRWFLDRIATHVLAFEGDSQVRWFEGNFSEYEAFRHKELGADADQPTASSTSRWRGLGASVSPALGPPAGHRRCFVGGIGGMIVGSILDNNGVAITFGLVTATAAASG